MPMKQELVEVMHITLVEWMLFGYSGGGCSVGAA